MPSKSEQVLEALLAILRVAVPPGAEVVRNSTLPTRIPPGGWLCLRDGDPGDPQFMMSPPSYYFEHEAEVDIVVDAPLAERDARFDALKVALGEALALDRTLGGLCDYVIGVPPVPVDITTEGGAQPLKAATVGIMLTYVTSDPLG